MAQLNKNDNFLIFKGALNPVYGYPFIYYIICFPLFLLLLFLNIFKEIVMLIYFFTGIFIGFFYYIFLLKTVIFTDSHIQIRNRLGIKNIDLNKIVSMKTTTGPNTRYMPKRFTIEILTDKDKIKIPARVEEKEFLKTISERANLKLVDNNWLGYKIWKKD